MSMADQPASLRIFILESLMAHEEKLPVEDVSGVAYTYGIHPWFLNEEQLINNLSVVLKMQ
jgi:hypothetical protein